MLGGRGAARGFVRIRIYRICGIFRILLRPFAVTENPPNPNAGKRPPVADTRAVRNPENPIIPKILILTIPPSAPLRFRHNRKSPNPNAGKRPPIADAPAARILKIP